MKKITYKCFLCDSEFIHGPHIYNGRKLNLYCGLFVCKTCWEANHDGWNPKYESKLIYHLGTCGSPMPKRNAKGLLPRN